MTAYYFSFFLIAILAICAIVGASRGFVKTVAGFLSYIIAYIAANKFYSAGASLVCKLPFLGKLITPDATMPELESKTGFFEKIKAILSFILSNYINGGTDADMKVILNNYIAEFISKTIAFIVIFFVALLVCKLIVMLVDKFCELPVIHGANKLLGLVVGVFCGLFITWILSNLYVNSLLPILSEKWPTVFVPESAETAIMKFFIKYSPIALIMLVFDKIGAKA